MPEENQERHPGQDKSNNRKDAKESYHQKRPNPNNTIRHRLYKLKRFDEVPERFDEVIKGSDQAIKCFD